MLHGAPWAHARCLGPILALALLCSRAAAQETALVGWTEAQRASTAVVLQAFAAAMPGLGWEANFFCDWSGVMCGVTEVQLNVTGVTLADLHVMNTLPEMPSGVDYTHVVLTQVGISGLGSHLTGSLPRSWSSLTSLMVVLLNGNDLSGTLPCEWGSLPALYNLDLSDTNVSGTLPPSWSSMAALSQLLLRNTPLTGGVPEDWSALTQLSSVSMDNTDVHGTLPVSWQSLRSLRYLWLQNTRVSGTLPAAWASITALEQLVLAGTQVTGTLPEMWGAMRAVQFLWLHHTALSGTLPPSWGALTSLTSLYLADTHVSGTLPAQWQNMVSLSTLHLENCNLSGTLPELWGLMPALRTIVLTGNTCLGGCVPAMWARRADVQLVLEPRFTASDCAEANTCVTSSTSTTTTTRQPAAETCTRHSQRSACEVDGCAECVCGCPTVCDVCEPGLFLAPSGVCVGECADSCAATPAVRRSTLTLASTALLLALPCVAALL
ncbi:hypothetical protein NESM_000879900 [Novymonas esmeraldas]|uniref:Uncharacterized protein n=1 Tax=Novymonas esmeraldas TaxID=1808958 RepID=A0AAW0F1I1_9TRYP